MSIVSFSFLFFLALFCILYFIFPKKIQWILLLAGNLFFYAFSGYQYLVFLLSCTFFTWYAALRIEKNASELKTALSNVPDKEDKAVLRRKYGKKKNGWITIALILTLGVWIVLKYGPFLLDSIASICKLPELQGSLKFIVPLGMSFYTFDAIGYMIDVSRSKYPAEKNYFKYLTFVSFFPHIIQGPFSRFDKLGKSLFYEHGFSFDRLSQGFGRILWGYFKKMLIADKLALTVNEIFSNYGIYSGTHILLVIFLYGIQIYADFSGYMDIVCGISHVLGISLEENFRQPFFAVSVEEFWRRWHITLGHWFRDYLFYPISMGKRAQRIGKKVRSRFGPQAGKHVITFISLFWVWSATGLWHGANWTYLIWGWLNLFVLLLSQVLDPWYEKARNFCHISLTNKAWHLFRIIRTFCLVCFFRLFSRADSLRTAVDMMRKIFTDFNKKLLASTMSLFPGMKEENVYIVLASVVILLIVDILSEKGKWTLLKEKMPFPIRDLAYVLLIASLILFAGNGEDIAKNFIYANF